MDQQEIVQLIIKHIRQEITDMEERRLQGWIAEREENKVFFERFVREEDVQEMLHDYGYMEPDKEKDWKRIVEMGLPAPKTKTSFMRVAWWQYATAAAVLIAVAGIFFLWKQEAPVHQQQVVDRNIIEALSPGSNKATLTLAGGKTIQLDDATVGELARQGSTSIIKLDSGRLGYRSAGYATEATYNTLTTPRGGQYQITLPDGSEIWLNSASSVRFPVAFNGKERRIEVTGEVYCDIAHNSQMPFRIVVGDNEIEVLGTSFNINAYKDENNITTTLLKGAIRLTAHRQAAQVVLKPGEQAMVPNTGDGKVEKNNTANLEQVVAWKNGYFMFENEELPVIMRQLEKWYDLEVVYKGQGPKIEFTGTLHRNANADNVLQILEGMGLRYRMDGKKLIVLP